MQKLLGTSVILIHLSNLSYKVVLTGRNWPPLQDLNLYQRLRRSSFYPVKLRGGSSNNSLAKKIVKIPPIAARQPIRTVA